MPIGGLSSVQSSRNDIRRRPTSSQNQNASRAAHNTNAKKRNGLSRSNYEVLQKEEGYRNRPVVTDWVDRNLEIPTGAFDAAP